MTRDPSVDPLPGTPPAPARRGPDADFGGGRSNRRSQPLSITTFRAFRGALICVAITAGAALGIVLLASRQLAETTRELETLGGDLVGLKDEVRNLANRVARGESLIEQESSAPSDAGSAAEGAGDESLEEIRFRLAALGEGLRELDERQDAVDTIAELARLADEAIVNGSRFAYRKLLSRLGEIEVAELRDAAEAQLMRVEAYYVSTRPYQSYAIPVADLHPTASREEDLLAGDLARLLTSPDLAWPIRAQAARLLGRLEGEGEGEALAPPLLEAIRTDPHLGVVQESLLALEALTDFQADGVFDEEGAMAWWEKANR